MTENLIPRFGAAAVALAAILMAGTSPSAAKSLVFNNTDQNVNVFWTASNCLGVAGSCFNFTNVCRRVVLKPGKQEGYKYKVLATDQRVIATNCKGKGYDQDKREEGGKNNGLRGRCAINYIDDKFSLQLKCGYNRKDFSRLKHSYPY